MKKYMLLLRSYLKLTVTFFTKWQLISNFQTMYCTSFEMLIKKIDLIPSFRLDSMEKQNSIKFC